jgi:hypothetical protein
MRVIGSVKAVANQKVDDDEVAVELEVVGRGDFVHQCRNGHEKEPLDFAVLIGGDVACGVHGEEAGGGLIRKMKWSAHQSHVCILERKI